MIYERLFEENAYVQAGRSCYLSCYYLLLYYYTRLEHPMAVVDAKNVFVKFLDFVENSAATDECMLKNTLAFAKTLAPSYDSSKDRTNPERKRFEDVLHSVFCGYANGSSHRNLSGYEVIAEFDQWLFSHKDKLRPKDIILHAVRCCKLQPGDSLPLDVINSEIHNSHCLILIGYPNMGLHSVLKFETTDRKEMLFRDPNYPIITSMVTQVNDSIYISPQFDSIKHPATGDPSRFRPFENDDIGEYIVAKKRK